mmetsp:Transcript_6102/g.10357  ORF Transcript_6102/g.10357 Transcript_6102/m.10357 type:complete len:256 (+) Transcript_6102:339-1106(+)|eukprot:CAMPEP_0168614860 /NCGR_PEP_ID=MMETSP0449_2-20121227/4201_1 /TAXON_ID=1082188 /ORGANISM="Strombidium rassoulzadegani, Strain ras09" /LENGTH=255 /DNA_ID=CAMNT_0008655571 /DNA_START=236 /DNA_END=1003 /DNA_ORIENTATION=-
MNQGASDGPKAKGGFKAAMSKLAPKLNQSDMMKIDPITYSCEIDKSGIKIDSKGLFIRVDCEGLTDYTTGERNSMILPNDIKYLEEIGSGNGGVVQKAEHRQTGIFLAIKIINVYDKNKRHQLYNELKAIRQFESPFLLRCYGAFFHQGSVRLVLEYMDCGSMETIIKVLNQLAKRGVDFKMPELVISRIICHILNGIHYLHNVKQQIHRDIKPDNILLSSEMGLAKLSDFGISKQLEINPNPECGFSGQIQPGA